MAAGQMICRKLPDLVLVDMKRSLRRGKIFIDWSQNSRHKTTIAPYSLRARPHPTVSTPVTWAEVSDGADGGPLGFEADDVLARVESLGDLFAPTQHLEQVLPGGS